MGNLEVAELLRSVASAYEIKEGDSPNTRFKVIAYERAADSVEHATSEARDLWQQGKLDEIAGVGKAISEHLGELFATGKSKHFDEVLRDLPPAMFEFLEIPGIGAKTAYKLARELGISKAHSALEKLEKAAEREHIREIQGFGEQSEKEILDAIKEIKQRTKRHLLPYALMIADGVLEYLRTNSLVERADPLGSLRRRVATVGDIDIAVASKHPAEVIEHFSRYPKKVKIIEKGEATSSILLPGGVQVDLMVQPPEAYGALLQHFTGSKHHNIALRNLALKKGMSLSEKGIKKLKAENEHVSGAWPFRLKTFKDEESFYGALGMDWIPPELREDQGEIEASLKGELPRLVDLGDIKGDLHLHSNFPQETSHDSGEDSMEEMVEEARRLGYEYLAFTEHNPKSSETEGKILDVLRQKKERVDKLNLQKILKKVFNGLEVDITPSGSLALPERAFDFLDFAVVGVHSSFKGGREKQTKRVLRALEHPKVKIFAHPTSRRLDRRQELDLDWEKIFKVCKKREIWLEINSSPDRLDLPDILVREAVRKGVKLVIDTDAHTLSSMRPMEYGVSVARRGWAKKSDIMNTLSYEEFIKEVI